MSSIYHLAIAAELRAWSMACAYKPGAFDQDGFIHCTGDRETLLAVANDYFASVSEPVLVLVIETARVQAEVRLEPAAPVQGGGTSHLQGAALFPHIYGPLNLDAVVEIGALRRSGGTYAWPDRFVPPDRWPSL